MRSLLAVLLTVPALAQTLVVNRPPGGGAAIPQSIERGAKGSFADAFQIGTKGQVWMIDEVRVWGMPAASPACSRQLGDEMERLTLYGALDNPPVPGQPVCDCHALVALASAGLSAGTSTSNNAKVEIHPDKGLWQLDFHDVRWSVPGGMDVLFAVRATQRRSDACGAAAGWALAASPAGADYKLHLLNQKGVPVGLEPQRRDPRTVDIQVWARRTQ